MKVSILTIGDEILIGQIVDTNSAWMGTNLNKHGIAVDKILSISDKKEDIVKGINDLLLTADVVIITGGLGPTNDDVTKETLCEMYDASLYLNEEALKNVESFLRKRNAELNENNRNQALFPDKADFIPNNNGTASGMWFEHDGKVVVSLPGVPHEMESMMSETVIPKICKQFSLPHIYHKVVHTTGMPEAKLAEVLEEWEAGLDDRIALAYLPSPGLNKLRLSITGEDKNEIESVVADEIEKLKEVIADYIIGYDNDTIASIIGAWLKENGKTLSVAESCTTGNLAAEIASVPGCSAYFNGGAVAYANTVKINVLGVDESVIEENGAVSQPVVELMAQGAQSVFNADYAIATSGVAGPSGGTVDKPVGTVWISVATPDKVISKCFTFGSDRTRNIKRSVTAALELLRRELVH